MGAHPRRRHLRATMRIVDGLVVERSVTRAECAVSMGVSDPQGETCATCLRVQRGKLAVAGAPPPEDGPPESTLLALATKWEDAASVDPASATTLRACADDLLVACGWPSHARPR